MKTHFARIVFLLLAVLVLGTAPDTALAQCGSPVTSTFPTRITVCPSGDLFVSGTVRDALGNTCPAQNITMSSNSPCLCNAPLAVTATSSLAGVVTFGPRTGGFCAAAGVVTFTDAAGVVLGTAAMVNSPDINGDCIVNLVDVTSFAQSYAGVAPIAQADYNYDGILNLIDVGVIAAHLGH